MNSFIKTIVLFFCLLTGLMAFAQEQMSDVATVYLDTYDGSGITDKTTWKYARITEVFGDSIAVYDSVRVRGRGNSTWGLEKKPYRIKFNKKVKWLGKGYANSKNWVLMANHADKTMLRNAVASFIGTELGQPFTPGARFVDLVLNGEYLGTYQITDHIDIHKHRVDITEQEEPANAESNITGGYLVECDGFYDDDVRFRTNRSVPCNIKSPDEEVINDDQILYIRKVLQAFEDALFSGKYTDPEKGYRALVDSTTLISWYLATEFTGNPDGYWSANIYKEADDPLLYWGPMWDYDIAFNNCNRIGEATELMMSRDGFGSGVIRPWVQQMTTDPWFDALAAREWKKAVDAGIVDRTLAYIDSMAVVIDETQALNYDKYRIDKRVYNEITLYSTYQEGVDYLKDFVREHALYLSKYFSAYIEEPEDDTGKYGTFDTSHYFRIRNVGNQHLLDITGDYGQQVCTWSDDASRESTQTWQLVQGTKANYYMIVSPDSGLAITDFADEYNTVGTQLLLDDASSTNPRQQWRFVKTASSWVIENMGTSLAWNNAGGSSSNGNRIISWTNNEDNDRKPNRQWEVEETSIITSLNEFYAEVEYRVLYNPDTHQLRISPDEADLSTLEGTVTVTNASGRRVAAGNITAPLDLSSLLPDVYVVSWNVGRHARSCKLKIPNK